MNARALKSLIIKYDGKQEILALAMGLSLSRLNAKINETGGAEFRQSEINFIRERYKLSEMETAEIFFTRRVS